MSETTEGGFLDKNTTNTMKGAAIICVTLCHFMGGFGSGTVLFTPLGGIGVSIFLMLSAYGLSESYVRGGGGDTLLLVA